MIMGMRGPLRTWRRCGLVRCRERLEMIRLLAGVLLLILAGCGGDHPSAPTAKAVALPRAAIPAAEIAALQGIADDACRCSRASPDDRTCWETFSARTVAHQPSPPVGTACAPVSTALTCFNEDQPEARFCITTGHDLVGTDYVLCSAEEARIVDATFTATLKRTGDNYEQANAAARKAASDLILGSSVPLPDAEGGCTG